MVQGARSPLQGFRPCRPLADMTGPRPGGFGLLNNRPNEICGTGVCLRRAGVPLSTSPNCRGLLKCSPAVPASLSPLCTPRLEFWNLDGAPALNGHWVGAGA